MRKVMARWINRTLTPFGLEVRRKSSQATIPEDTYPEKYPAAVAELQGYFSELVFPNLSPSEDRLKLLCKLIGTSVGEGLYVVGLLGSSLDADGDVCEFGVAQGATSALLANEIRHTQKHLWLFDSFEGLPQPTAKDQLIDDIFNLGSIEKYAGTMANPVELVKQRLADIQFPPERTHIVPGFIEQTIKSAKLPETVCFAYVDFDFYEPILTALRFLRSRVPVGGAIMVDDYGWFSSGAQTAVDEFVAEVGSEFQFSLPLKSAAKFCILRKQRQTQTVAAGNGRMAS